MSIVNYRVCSNLKHSNDGIMVGNVHSVRRIIPDRVALGRDLTLSREYVINFDRLIELSVCVECAADRCRRIAYKGAFGYERNFRTVGLRVEVTRHKEESAARADILNELCRREHTSRSAYMVRMHVIDVKRLCDLIVLENNELRDVIIKGELYKSQEEK